tara:strand:- start:9 stop:383 length:375 start_codon:yes stop_codon:yes gene_type:complete
MEEQSENNKVYMVQKIKNWLAVESKISELSNQLKELRKMRKDLNVDLLEIMKTNEIDCFDCNSGKIMYTKNNVKKTISKKYLTDILQKYYGNENSSQAENLCNFILENRQIEVKENIKLKKPNN